MSASVQSRTTRLRKPRQIDAWNAHPPRPALQALVESQSAHRRGRHVVTCETTNVLQTPQDRHRSPADYAQNAELCIKKIIIHPRTSRSSVDSSNEHRRRIRDGSASGGAEHPHHNDLSPVERNQDDPEWSYMQDTDSLTYHRARCKVVNTSAMAGGDKAICVVATGTIEQRDGSLQLSLDGDVVIPVVARSARGKQARSSGPSITLQIQIQNPSSAFGSIELIDDLQSSDTRTIADVVASSADYSLTTDVEISIPHSISRCSIYWAPSQETFIKDYNSSALLDIMYTWRPRSRTSALEMFNVATRTFFEPGPLQLPTPDASQGPRHDDRESSLPFKVIFIFRQTHRLVQQNLNCPLCQRDLAFVTFSRLHLHLHVHHDYFDFTVMEQESEDGLSIDRTINFTLAEQESRKANIYGKDEVQLDWIAPREPFNETAFLRGKPTAWTAKLAKVNKATKMKATVQEPITLSEPTYVRMPPQDVPDLAIPALPKHPVPTGRHAGTRFYRTGSKRLVSPGDLIDESDNDLDEFWLEERNKQELRTLRLKTQSGAQATPLSAVQQEFMLQWNTHLAQEIRLGMNGVRYKRESVIRFARRYRHKLTHSAWRRLFDEHLKTLVRRRIVDQEDCAYCLPVDRTTMLLDHMSDGERPITSESHAAASGSCRCGEVVSGIRGVIYCSNEKCAHGALHMKCFNLQTRPDGWWCPDCLAMPGD